MSILIYFLFGALTFFLFLMIFGLFLPKNAHVERSIIINVTPSEVFEEVVNYENFVTWNPWSEKDPNMQHSFQGETGTIGSKYSWKGNKKVGSGYMQITDIVVNEHVEMDLNFGPRGNAKCGFVIQPNENGTRIIWYFDSPMGNFPLKRIVGAMMDKFIGTDYSIGLSNLQAKLEKQQ
jgi:uncharacterized protein YndB with AHSA1/START domain